MTYNEATLAAYTGDILMLPNWEGYFRWNYNLNYLEFYNEDYRCPADNFDIKNRTDWYKII